MKMAASVSEQVRNFGVVSERALPPILRKGKKIRDFATDAFVQRRGNGEKAVTARARGCSPQQGRENCLPEIEKE